MSRGSEGDKNACMQDITAQVSLIIVPEEIANFHN
jgi:hypothetical protein